MVTDVKITSETKVVAEKLSELLAERNLTHREVADQAGVSDALIGAIVNKKRNVSPEVLVRLSAALGVSTDYLLGLYSIEDVSTLERVKKEKEHLENIVRALFQEAATLKSSDERAAKMQEISAVEEQIMRLEASIKRASLGLLKIPEVFGRGTAYRPAEFVEADSCVVVHDQNIALPPESIIFVKHNHESTPGEVLLIKKDGSLQLTKIASPDSDVVGKATYVVVPAHTYVQNCHNE